MDILYLFVSNNITRIDTYALDTIEPNANKDRPIFIKHSAMLKTPILKKSHIGDAIAGIVTVFAIDILIIFIALCLNTLSPIFMSVIFSIGLVQMLYIIPLYHWSVKRRVKGFSKGLLFGAIAIAALNFGCFLVTFKFFQTGAR